MVSSNIQYTKFLNFEVHPAYYGLDKIHDEGYYNESWGLIEKSNFVQEKVDKFVTKVINPFLNDVIHSKWQVILKLYELYAIREYFDKIENYTTAQRIGGKRRKKTKNKLKKKRKTIKKKK